jgi:hypothetical protein
MAQLEQNHDKLSGIIEVDEFFLAHSEKGSNNLIGTHNTRLCNWVNLY